jgi:hypothetical protein
VTQRARGVVLLAIQLVLVLSIAAKYVYERKTCPRVWVRTAQIDPNLPFRGRYLSLQLVLDACGLPHDNADSLPEPVIPFPGGGGPSSRSFRWKVKPEASDGKLIAVIAGDNVRPELTQELTQWGHRSCDHAVLSQPADYFIGDRAKSPFPLKPNEELWAEVTVPSSGPPRPIQLAISSDAGFRPLVIR